MHHCPIFKRQRFRKAEVFPPTEDQQLAAVWPNLKLQSFLLMSFIYFFFTSRENIVGFPDSSNSSEFYTQTFEEFIKVDDRVTY